jgi:hypothetical protein
MTTISYLQRLADHPEVAYEGYGELRAAGKRRNSGFANPADIPLMEAVIRRRGRDWCQSVIGKPMFGGLRSISGADADMLMVADERGFEPPMPAWLEQWKAESAATLQARDEIRTAALERDRQRWAAALAGCQVEVEVRPNANGRRLNSVLAGPLRHTVPLADARSKRRLHQAGRALCETADRWKPLVLGSPTEEPATCKSCVAYTAEIRPAAAAARLRE